MHILLIAEESIGIDTLRHIAGARSHELTVMASPAKSTLSGATVWSVAEEMGLPCWPAREVKGPAFPQKMMAHGIDLLLSIRSRYILGADVIAAPRLGAFNLHTGPLPEYAGINVINWAIYNGETHHAVTLHHIDTDVDSGEVAYTAAVEIGATDSAAKVTKKCFRKALPLVAQLLDAAATNPQAIPTIAQDAGRRNWYGPSIPHDAFIPWHEGATRAVDFVRACDYYPFPSPWGMARTLHNEQIIHVLKASVTGCRADENPGCVGRVTAAGAMVSAGDYWVEVDEIMVDGERQHASETMRSGMTLTSR